MINCYENNIDNDNNEAENVKMIIKSMIKYYFYLCYKLYDNNIYVTTTTMTMEEYDNTS